MRKIRIGNGVAANSMLLTFVHVITAVLGIAATKLLSVHFSLQEYGTYAQALLVTRTATSISILGLTNATNYFYNRTQIENDQRQYVATIFSIQYLVGNLLAVLIIAFRSQIAAYFGNEKLVTILPIVAFTPFLQNLIPMCQVLFVSIGKAKVIAVRNLAVSSIRLVGVIVACFVLDNIVTMLVVTLIMDVIQVLYFFILLKRYKNPIKKKKKKIGLVKEILAFSIPMSIYVLTNSLSRDIAKYVISAFANTEKLAIYANASRMLPFDMLTSSLITVLIPTITGMINRQEYKNAQNVFKLYLRMGYVLTFIFVGGAIAVSKNLMLFLYDTKYLVGLNIFIIYLVVDMVRFANVTTILSGAGKTKILMVVSVVAMVLNAVLDVVGYKLLGLVGPAIFTLFLTIVMTIALLYFGAKEIHSKILDLFDFKEIAVIAVQIIAVGVFVSYLSSFLSQKQMPYVFSLILCYGLYILILGLLNYRRVLDCYRKLNQYKLR